MSRTLVPFTLVSAALAAATPGWSRSPVAEVGAHALPQVSIDARCLGTTPMEESVRPSKPAPMGRGGGGRAYGALGGLVGSASASAENKATRTRQEVSATADAASVAVGPSSPSPARKQSRLADADAEQDSVAPTHTVPRPRPFTDWGGTIHLSNDDAMSLASAQRVLWAVEQGASLPVEHIRPHELLNYFSFDASPPSDGALVGVSPSAFREGDTLRLAVDVSTATPPRGPVDLTVLVDRSGSMQAEGRMDYTRRALQQATARLQHGDRLDLVVFDHTVCTPIRDFVVGRDDPSLVAQQLSRLSPRGSTDLDAGLQEAYRIARDHAAVPGRSGRVMVFTDAQLNTGRVDPHLVTEVGSALDEHGIRLTGVGVGRSFRDDVLDALTEKGRGAYVFLGSEAVVDRLFGQGFDALIHTVAEDVRFSLALPDTLGMKAFHGEESSRDPAEVTPVMLAAGSHQVFFSDLAVRAGHLSGSDPVTFEASWTDPKTGRRAGMQRTWRVDELLGASERDARKAAALMAWSDLLLDRAMGGETCGASYATFLDAARRVPGDAEIAWVSEITGKGCGASTPVAQWTAPAHLKVRVDADQPIGSVALDCPDGQRSEVLRAGDQVASFDVAPGSCLVTLHGAVPMVARVDVPSQGVAVSCRVRGGRIACR